MAGSHGSICFQCGQPSRCDRFNRLLDGRPCPACCERLLATLPALIPGIEHPDEPEVVDTEHEFDDDIPA